MLDVHPPPHAATTWKDFFIHIAQPAANPGAPELWTMTPDQADHFAAAAAETKIAIQGLLFRLRWSKVYEQGIINGESAADIKMMTINQEIFEDPPTP